MNTYEKYWRIIEHPAFINDAFERVTIEIEPHMICPSTNRIENYKPLNTKLQYWVELMVPYYEENSISKQWVVSHDWELDCGGFTYEEAIDELYDLVIKKYGDYTKEEAKQKNDEMFGRLSGGSSPFFAGIYEPSPIQSEIIEESDIDSYESDLKGLKESLNALTEYRKTANIDELVEIDERIDAFNHDILELELCIAWRFDVR